MMRDWISPLFAIAAIYDFGLGLLVLTLHPAIYRYFEITPPNHPGYVELPAALVTIFGVGFWMVSRDPRRNRDIIRLGVLLKLAYAGIVLGHAADGNMPGLWLPFAWIDLGFAVAFWLALRALRAGGGRRQGLLHHLRPTDRRSRSDVSRSNLVASRSCGLR